MKHYWQILKTYKKGLILCPLLVLIFVVCETLQPTLMARVVDEGIMQKKLEVVTSVGVKMLLISVVGFLASMANIFFSSQVGIGFSTDLRRKLFSKIQEFSFFEIDTFNSSSLITRLTSDISRLQTLVLMSLRLLLRAPMMIILALFFVIRVSPGLSWIVGVSIPILALSLYLILTKGFPLFVIVQEKVDKINAVVRENLINIRVVKSFVREDFEKKKFHRSSEELQDAAIKASNMAVSIFPMMQLVMNISVALILWFGGNKVIHGDLKVGQLISVVNYLTQILISLMILSIVFVMSVRASASSKRIKEVLDTEPDLKNSAIGLQNIYKLTYGEIEMQNVCFRYPGSENDILKSLSFHVKTGELIAVVGATGSGKSTMLQLIPRLYDTTVGNVFIDGENVRDFNLDELHSKIGMVLQKNELFAGTIEENLRWGNPNASDQEIRWAAQMAEASEFVESFTDGYKSLLGRGGINVSGGQKQRLCIARALLLHPRILILDDSTSAVDTKTERSIMTNIRQVMKDTTVLMVTQRVSNMHAADRIIVLDDGTIESIGTHDELMQRSPIYQEIYFSQQIETEKV
ncbi:MAG: ABC transporter ATP-binding protein [Dysgonamonadaceae bacterium]